MTLAEKLEVGQSKAPSYCYLEEDGDKYKCPDCGFKLWGHSIVKTFTPDGISHKAICIDCIDPDWISLATKLEFKL